MEILKGRGVHNGNLRAWEGGNAFWNFQRQGEVKTWKLSVVGYGYFQELPNTRQTMGSKNNYETVLRSF